MTYRSPKPLASTFSLSGTALNALTDSMDWLDEHKSAIQDMLDGDPTRLTGRWIAKVTDSVKSTGVPIWVYTVVPADLTIPRTTAGVVNGTVTSADSTDLTMRGNAYNLRELLNTATVADGVDISALPGTFAVKPITGFVECWHQRLANGDVVIMFAERNAIDGACSS
jgi:hypothetical protein